MSYPSFVFSLLLRLAPVFCACLAGCVSSPIPAPVMPRVSRAQTPDAALVAVAREQWYILADSSRQKEWSAALQKYNRALDLLFRRVRYDHFGPPHRRLRPDSCGFRIALGESLGVDFDPEDVYEDLVPAADIDLDDLEERCTVPGAGIPLAGVVLPEKAGELGAFRVIKGRRNVHSLTAVLTFPKDPRSRELPVMRLFSRLNRERVPIGRWQYELAADFSAPIALYWQMTDVQSMRLLGLFRPMKAVDVTGLSFNEPYNPNKIPVVLTHGLMSSPNTFSNLVNRLLRDPEIRRNYQFWYFGYPTGIPWMVSAADYREALREARRELDPRRRNRRWDEMVVIGHSMGGLITRYSLSREPWLLLKGSLSSKGEREFFQPWYIDHPFADTGHETFRKSFYFRPLEEPKRAIYLATPHRGAPFADNWIAAIGSWLIRIPVQLVTEAVKVATFQEDMFIFRPQELVRSLTSINQLSPRSGPLKNLSSVPLRRVPSHSVIGDRGRGDTPRSSDGIVPYWSSHLAWSNSEKIVPHDHSVQDDPATAEEVMRILKLHLAELGRASSARRGK